MTVTTPLTLQITREVQPTEVASLIYGTGMLTYSWWRGCYILRGERILNAEQRDTESEYDGSEVVRILHESLESDKTESKDLTLQQVVDAVGKVSALGLSGSGDLEDMLAEHLGLADSFAADIVMQMAVYDEIVFG